MFLGRVVRPGEPEWLPDDTEAVLEWIEYQQSLCSGCSHPRHESFDPDGPQYEVRALRCRACEAREDEAKSWSKDKNSDPSGVYFVAVEQT